MRASPARVALVDGGNWGTQPSVSSAGWEWGSQQTLKVRPKLISLPAMRCEVHVRVEREIWGGPGGSGPGGCGIAAAWKLPGTAGTASVQCIAARSAGPARQSFPAVRACCSRHADGPRTVVPGKHPVLPRCYPFSINVH